MRSRDFSGFFWIFKFIFFVALNLTCLTAPWNMCPACWRAPFSFCYFCIHFYFFFLQVLLLSHLLSLLFLLLALLFFSCIRLWQRIWQAEWNKARFVITFWCFTVYSCQVVPLPCQNYIINFSWLPSRVTSHGVVVILRWLRPLICIKMFTNIFLFITMKNKTNEKNETRCKNIQTGYEK